MAQQMYIDHGRCFFKLGPIAPTTLDIELLTNDGEFEDLDGASCTLRLYNARQLVKEYDGTITGNTLTITISEDVPEDPGLYVLELIADTEVYEGWVENLKSPNERSREVLTTTDVLRNLQTHATGMAAQSISIDDFSSWMVAQAMQFAVELWNSAANTEEYTVQSFPYLSKYREGVLGYLFQFAGMALSKERMPTQDGGIALDDKIRADYYNQTAERLLFVYRDWVSHQQYKESLLNGFGVI